MTGWHLTELSSAVLVNPSERLARGAEASFIDMASVAPDFGGVQRVSRKQFTGGGARFRKGDTLVARITPCLENGKIAVVPDLETGVGFGSTEFVVLRGDGTATDSRFVGYLAMSSGFRDHAEQNLIGSSGRQRVSADIIGRYVFSLPPLDEQKRIASVLGAFDDLIETNRRLMVQIRRVVRSAWDRAVAGPPLEVPFFDAFDVEFGAPFAGAEFAQSGVGRPLIRIRDLKTLAPDTWTTQSRPDETVIEPGDVLVGMDAEFVPTYWLGASGVLNQRVMRVQSKYGGPGLCCEALRDPMAFVQGYKTGTTVAHLNKADLQTLTVRIPDDRRRAVFDEATRGLIRTLVGLAQESADLARQRDELLPLLMSGKVRVRDVEAEVS